MTARKMIPLAAALGLLAGGPAYAEPKAKEVPAASKADNQKLADSVAAKLKTSGVVKGAKVSIETRGGVVMLSGSAMSQKQHEDILRSITGVPGIVRIESEIVVPAAAPAVATAPIQRTGGEGEPAVLAVPPVSAPLSASGAATMQEPVPLNAMAAMGPMDAAGPKLPPHAWPTYAPYNNYSRVAYPGAYPYNAFPYIGPFYPFPKVPLGWRKVVLEWEDGHWWLGRKQAPVDYWRVKFGY